MKVIIINNKGNSKKSYRELQFEVKKDGQIFLRGNYIMLTLKQGQSVDFTLVALDFKGRPASVDGVPTFANSNPGAADLFVNPDGFSGKITWLDGGNAQITAKVDADLGEGVREITAIADINCLAPEAVTFDFSFGTPTP